VSVSVSIFVSKFMQCKLFFELSMAKSAHELNMNMNTNTDIVHADVLVCIFVCTHVNGGVRVRVHAHDCVCAFWTLPKFSIGGAGFLGHFEISPLGHTPGRVGGRVKGREG
jgi:hypothetical protein